MVTRTFDGAPRASSYDETVRTERAAEGRGYHGVGDTVFVWVAWALAFAFWAFTMSSFFGILRDIAAAGPGTLMGGVDMGGASWAVIDVFGGVVVLGLILVYGTARWATRNRALDPMTEEATRRLYDEGSV